MKRHMKTPYSKPPERERPRTAAGGVRKPPAGRRGVFAGRDDKRSTPYAPWRLSRNLSLLRCDLRAAFEAQTGKEGTSYVKRSLYPDGGHAAFEAIMDALRPPGMTWDNYFDDWFAWWVIPPSSFDLSDPAQRRQCFSFENLSPQPPPYPSSRVVYGNGFLSD